MTQTPRSDALFERAKRVAPGGVHSPVRSFRGVGGTPRFIRSAQGCRLTDVDGNTYIDYCMSWGPLLFGHQDPEVSDAVFAAIQRGWTYGTAEPLSLELAELITHEIPWVQKLRFVNSGTEAVMSALRVARAATRRHLVLKFDGCYHGHVDSLLVRAGSGLADMASPDSAGVSPQVAAETLVIPLDDLKALKQIETNFGNQLAAVIIEPLPANNGLLPQRESYLRELRQFCDRTGALLIFDEVISGFRTAFGGMAEVTGVTPDLVTYGKVIGGGFPVGAYGGRAELMDWVAPMGPVYQAGTLSANPVSMAAGIAMIKKLLREKPYAMLSERGESFAHELQSLAESHIKNWPTPVSFKVERFGSLSWIRWGNPKLPDDIVRRPDQIPAEQKTFFPRLFHSLLEKGVYLAPSGYEVSFLSTAHSKKDLQRTLEQFDRAFLEIGRA